MDLDFKKKLAAYGALSSAFVLSGSHEAEAQIIYVDLSDPPTTVSTGKIVNAGNTAFSSEVYNTVNLDLENGVVNAQIGVSTYADLAFKLAASNIFSRNVWTSSSNTFSSSWYFATAQNGLIAGNSNVVGTSYASNLSGGQVVSSGASFASWSNLGNKYNTYGSTIGFGNFQKNGENPSDVTGFIGVRFDKGGNTHYGWVRIRVELDAASAYNGPGTFYGASSRLTILDYAYNDTPDAPIRVGEGLPPPIPTMGQWGLIILNLLLVIFGVKAVVEQRKLKLEKAE
jgi:hypothetical protein